MYVYCIFIIQNIEYSIGTYNGIYEPVCNVFLLDLTAKD